MRNTQSSIKFGKKLRQERIKRGFSQERLAYKAGLNKNYIGMLERAENNVTLPRLEKIAKALGMKVRDLVDF